MTVTTQAGPVAMKVVSYMARDRSRTEIGPDTVIVTDLTAKKQVILDLKAKTATMSAITPADGDDPPAGLPPGVGDFMTKLTDLKGDGVKALPPAMLNGRWCDRYEIPASFGGQPSVWTVWVDPALKLPVKLASAPAAAGQPAVTVTIEFSDWNAKFDPKLFSLDVPAGYTLIEADKPAEDRSPAKGEKYVVLRQAADNAAKATSARIVRKVERDGKTTVVADSYWQGDLSRFEMVGKLVLVRDLKAKQTLGLDLPAKTAERRALTEEEVKMERKMQTVFNNPLAIIREKQYAVRQLPDEKIGDRRMEVFEIAGPPKGGWPGGKAVPPGRLWIDADTKLPARLLDAEMGPGVTLEFSDWNATFDPKLFSLDPPEGYKAEPPKPAGPTGPKKN